LGQTGGRLDCENGSFPRDPLLYALPEFCVISEILVLNKSALFSLPIPGIQLSLTLQLPKRGVQQLLSEEVVYKGHNPKFTERRMSGFSVLLLLI
jgi:hypothetical protein